MGVIQMGMKFETAGTYRLHLFGDGKLVKTFDVHVVLLPSQKEIKND
jgi:hypothetical protein